MTSDRTHGPIAAYDRRRHNRRTLRAPSLLPLISKRKVHQAAPRHLVRRHFAIRKRCKNQCADKPLRPGGASEREFALSCLTPSHHFLAVCPRNPACPSRHYSSHSIRGLWPSHCTGESRMASRCSWAPVLVEHCCGRTEARWKRRPAFAIRSFDNKFGALGASSAEHRDLRKRGEHLQNLSQSVEAAAEAKTVEAPKGGVRASLRRAHGQQSV